MNQQNLEFAANMKCSVVQRISERRNASLADLNFWQKVRCVCAAAVTVDLSRLPNEDETLSNSSHSEEESSETLYKPVGVTSTKLSRILLKNLSFPLPLRG
ncbi:hypothetical protein AVEN_209379-1 [Araneus ventricosus]|uniref:Uncharacterized protein n=1 Tax=Araneus ventricosus TaxID=182803 RepID=A0A4Y2Q7X7_ARAVE|nr:hypothetical protein AVEN_209379-1 [Araneus ventricosus]